jgi:hypothetical protein
LATRHADRQHDEYAQDHLAQNVALSFHTSSLFHHRRKSGNSSEKRIRQPTFAP